MLGTFIADIILRIFEGVMKAKEAIILFKSDIQFTDLAPKTRTEYARYLDIICVEYGNLNILKFAEREHIFKMRSFFKSVIHETPRKGEFLLAVFRVFYRWCYNEGFIRKMLLDHFKLKCQKSSTKKNGWQQSDFDYIYDNAPESLKNYLMVALETGLRRCDIIRLKNKDFFEDDNQKLLLRITQQKTGDEVIIPVSNAFKKWLESHQNNTDYILVSTNGTPWTENKFNHAWQRMRKRLKFTDITPHGLRKMALTRLVKAGCTISEISAILGWKISTVTRMMDNHYFIDKVSVATSAIDKLNLHQAVISA